MRAGNDNSAHDGNSFDLADSIITPVVSVSFPLLQATVVYRLFAAAPYFIILETY